MPKAMTAEHITQVRAAFVNAARMARDAGFDGVEIHGANGYLLDAFLTDYLNIRTDDYGGSVANRVRLATEVCGDVVAAVGADIAVGIRISQGKVSDNQHRWAGGEDDAAEIFTALADTGIDYIHTTEYRALAPAFDNTVKPLAKLAKQYSRLSIIANGHLDDPHDAAAHDRLRCRRRRRPGQTRSGQPELATSRAYGTAAFGGPARRPVRAAGDRQGLGSHRYEGYDPR